MYESLSKPWQVCVDLAWEAYCAGSLPIAAVIVDDVETIIATGRNRIFEAEKVGPYLSNNPLAHAEVNAILALRKDVKPSNLTLYTTTEPCPLCMGALRMTGFVNAVYACRDPWAGCSSMTENVPYLKNKKMRVEYLANETFENVLTAMLLEAHGERNLRGEFYEAWQNVTPKGSKAARYLFDTKVLKTLSREKAMAKEMLEAITTLLDREFT
jgi:tRNA(adenine34) deaminase